MKTNLPFVVALLVWPAFSCAQEVRLSSLRNPPSDTREIATRKTELKRARAVSLIEQAATEAVLWEDAESAVSVLSEAADLLWGENPKARSWLVTAWEMVEKIDESESSGELRQIWRGSHRAPFRTLVLSVARKRDPRLAEKFLKKLEDSETEDQGKRGAFDDRTARSEQLLRLAIASVKANPSLAVALAERSLTDGISFNLQTLLLLLRPKHSDLANTLLDSALRRLTTVGGSPGEAQVLASYLFKPGEVLAHLPSGATGVAIVQTPGSDLTPAQSDPIRARRFLNIVQYLFVSAPLPAEGQNETVGDFVLLANSLAKPFHDYAPDLWPGVEIRTAQFAARISRRTSSQALQTGEEYKSSSKPSEHGGLDIDALEEEAQNEQNPIVRRFRFARAALATRPADLERGRALAGKIEGDELLSEQLLAFLYYRAALTLLHENELQKAEELGVLIPSSLERAVTLIAIAQRLALAPKKAEHQATTVTNRQRAIELLFEAEKSLTRSSSTSKTAKVRLGKVAVSNLVDASQAFSDFEQAIAVINRLERFDARDASAPRFGVAGFNNSELTTPRIELGFGCQAALEALVKEDFELTAAIIDRLSSPSTRGTFKIEIGRQVLQSIAKPHSQTKNVQTKF